MSNFNKDAFIDDYNNGHNKGNLFKWFLKILNRKNKMENNELKQRIKIYVCHAQGAKFANLTPQSEHDVIEAPKGVTENIVGVWVMGVGEPVKVLKGEYKLL